MLQPIEVTKSKRFTRDKLNISDIPGAQSDVYRKYGNLDGREYIDTGDIKRAQPSQLKQSKSMTGPDYKLYTKDINPEKWKSKRVVDPLKPEYDVPTISGRMVRIGQIERNVPKMNVSPQTKRFANYIDDIEGTRPKKGSAINDDQRSQANQSVRYLQQSHQSFKSNHQISRIYGKITLFRTRNSNIFGNPITLQPDQMKLLQESQNNAGPVPSSHYARFTTFQNLQQTANLGGGFDQSNNNTIQQPSGPLQQITANQNPKTPQ